MFTDYCLLSRTAGREAAEAGAGGPGKPLVWRRNQQAEWGRELREREKRRVGGGGGGGRGGAGERRGQGRAEGEEGSEAVERLVLRGRAFAGKPGAVLRALALRQHLAL